MLSRFNKLVVISSHASFAYKNKMKSFKEIGGELGVRYIIHGSVRKLGNKMRINTNLVSASNEKSIWSKNFDLSVDEVFDIQDKIVEEIVSTIVGREKDHLYLLENKTARKYGKIRFSLQVWNMPKKEMFLKKTLKMLLGYSKSHRSRAFLC